MRYPLPVLLCASIACASIIASAQTSNESRPLVLVGATLLDVTHYGDSAHDLKDAVVVLRGGKIEAVGTRSAIRVPKNAHVIDYSGKFLLPGLVDGFTGLNSQGQANATLYMGVTTVVGSQDDRRGMLKMDAKPSPHLYLIDSAGTTDDYNMLAHLPAWSAKLKDGPNSTELSPEDTKAQLEESARRGTRAIWLGHNLTAANTRLMVAECKRLHMATYGEFDSTPYAEGIDAGVDTLLHMTRYELGLAPAEMLPPLIKDPEGPAQNAPYDYVEKLDPRDASITKYAQTLKDHGVTLMPTFSLEYLMLPGHRNLWKEPAAVVLDPKDMFRPSDRATGELEFKSAAARDRAVAMYAKYWEINRTLAAAHPVYLAATGAAALGTMPGISMHTELELLVRVGLTPREALAAATNNYAETFGWHELGLIEAGRRADILVLDADPTVDIANSYKIAAVILDGSVVDREALLHLPK